MERGAKLYGALSQAQMEEAQVVEEHDYPEEQIAEDDLDNAEYFDYEQWEGEPEEETVQGASTGRFLIKNGPPQEEEYVGEDFEEEYFFNDEEEARRYMAKINAEELIGGDGEAEYVETEDGPSQHIIHEDDMHDAGTNPLFQMRECAGTSRRQATIVECNVCGVVLKHPSKIRAHLRTHTGERPFECTVCGKTFTQRTPWRMHEKRHALDLPFECSHGCGKAFPNASQRNAHDLRHIGRVRSGGPRPHLKPKRQMAYHDPRANRRVALEDERRGPPIIEAELIEVEPRIVPISATAQKQLDEVISAVAENRPVRQIPPREGDPNDLTLPRTRRAPPIVAECQICGLLLKHPSKIQTHMRSHTGVKLWQCNICGLSVGTPYALRMHHKRKHVEGERPLSCTWECGRRFVSVSARNEHERIVHAGIKRYECTVNGCRRMFSRRTHLVGHRLKDHPEVVGVEFEDIVDHDYDDIHLMEGEEEGEGEFRHYEKTMRGMMEEEETVEDGEESRMRAMMKEGEENGIEMMGSVYHLEVHREKRIERVDKIGVRGERGEEEAGPYIPPSSSLHPVYSPRVSLPSPHELAMPMAIPIVPRTNIMKIPRMIGPRGAGGEMT